MSEQIMKFFISNFPEDKLRTDLFNWLSEYMPDRFDGTGYNLHISEVNRLSPGKDVVLLPGDKVSALRYRYAFDLGGRERYIIGIAIGEYDAGEKGMYTVEKCEAVLRYDDSLELDDVDFEYYELAELEEWDDDLDGVLEHFVAMLPNAADIGSSDVVEHIELALNIEGQDYFDQLVRDLEEEDAHDFEEEYGLTQEGFEILKETVLNYNPAEDS